MSNEKSSPWPHLQRVLSLCCPALQKAASEFVLRLFGQACGQEQGVMERGQEKALVIAVLVIAFCLLFRRRFGVFFFVVFKKKE